MSSDVKKEKETLLIVDGRECAIFMIKDFNNYSRETKFERLNFR